MNLTQEDIARIASLSSLSLSQKEKDESFIFLTTIFSYIEQIREVDIQDGHATLGTNLNVFREDRKTRTDTDVITKNAPHFEEGYFLLPRVL